MKSWTSREECNLNAVPLKAKPFFLRHVQKRKVQITHPEGAIFSRGGMAGLALSCLPWAAGLSPCSCLWRRDRTVGVVPLSAPVQGVKQTKAVLQTPTVQRCPWDARTGKPLGLESSGSLAGRSCLVKPHRAPATGAGVLSCA